MVYKEPYLDVPRGRGAAVAAHDEVDRRDVQALLPDARRDQDVESSLAKLVEDGLPIGLLHAADAAGLRATLAASPAMADKVSGRDKRRGHGKMTTNGGMGKRTGIP